MEFSIQLSADYPNKSYGGDRVYQDMLGSGFINFRIPFTFDLWFTMAKEIYHE